MGINSIGIFGLNFLLKFELQSNKKQLDHPRSKRWRLEQDSLKALPRSSIGCGENPQR